MSTSSEKALCTSEDKNPQEKHSHTEPIEIKDRETQTDERRNLPCDLTKKIYPSDFRSWPILNLLKPNFIQQSRMIMVYGNYANKALIVTKDKNVYEFDHKDVHLKTDETHNGLYLRKIEKLCGKNIRTFACGTSFVLALTEEGEVYFWGFSNKRKIDGSNVAVKTLKPVRVDLSEKRIVDIVCGNNHSLALTSNGEVYTWGENNYGQLGNKCSDILADSLPRQVRHELEGKKIVHVACGSNFNMVVTDTGKLYGWGANESGQIPIDNAISSTGSSFTDSSSTGSSSTGICFASTATSTESKLKNIFSSVTHPIDPKLIVNPTSSISTNNSTSYNFSTLLNAPFLTSSSSKSLFDTNVTPSHFKFGSDNKVTSNNVELQRYYVYPREIVISGKVIVKVSCGYEHTLALTNEGKIYAWGKNVNGQVGVINIRKCCPPNLVYLPEMGKVLDIAACGNLSVAISNNKIVYVWGDYCGQDINVPCPTQFFRIDDAFAYSKSRIMHKPLILSTNDYEYVEEVSNIMKSLEAGFDDPSTSDCIVEVEGQRIYVHKAILQIRCQYFKNKSELQQNWFDDEYILSKDKQIYIASDKFSYIVYKAFLKYLYTGTVDLTSEDALDLMQLADEYDETNLKKECSRIIEQTITTSNVIFFYSKAVEFNAKELEEFCFQFALLHMKTVILSEEYIKLDTSTKDIFMRRAAEANAFRT